MNAFRPKYLSIPIDQFGMIPEELEKVMSRWTPEQCQDDEIKTPKVIYINPSAANPSGVSLHTERKQQIYDIARRYNILIIEDDPYYIIQFEELKVIIRIGD